MKIAMTKCLLIAVALGQTLVQAQGYGFRRLDFPGATGTIAKDINPLGDIVGAVTDTNGNTHGFLYKQGKFSAIDVPGATFTNAVGINTRGDIVGRWVDHKDNGHGYLLSDGKFRRFDLPGCEGGTTPRAINNAGEMAGTCIDGDGNDHAFMVTGSQTLIFDVPGADSTTQTEAYRITDEDEVVGYFTKDNNTNAAAFFRDASGHFRKFGVPGGIDAGARGINECLQIVGQFVTPKDAVTHGFLLFNGTYTTLDVPGVTYTVASGINNRGVIVGDYLDSKGRDRTYVATPKK